MHYHREYKHGDVSKVKTRWEGYARSCDVLGCDEKHYGKGFCKPHYRQIIGRHDQEWNDRRRANYQRRRAQKRMVPTEHVPLDVVRKRDLGICQLCGDPIGAEAWPHLLSPSLDHVIPLALGGSHTLANVQLAHLGCNLQKGAKVAA